MILNIIIEVDIGCPDDTDEFLIQEAIENEIAPLVQSVTSVNVEDDDDPLNPWRDFDVTMRVT